MSEGTKRGLQTDISGAPISDLPRFWRVQWKDVSHDESLAWFQASRRPGGAPFDGEEVVEADAYDRVVAQLQEAEENILRLEREASMAYVAYQDLANGGPPR